MRELENQMESVRSTQLQMRDTLHEILEQLRERPVEPVAHSPEEHRYFPLDNSAARFSNGRMYLKGRGVA